MSVSHNEATSCSLLPVFPLCKDTKQCEDIDARGPLRSLLQVVVAPLA